MEVEKELEYAIWHGTWCVTSGEGNRRPVSIIYADMLNWGCLFTIPFFECYKLKAAEVSGIRDRLKTQVLIIGGGVTGMGLVRDLSLRGVQCLVVEKGDINAGASGANHGLLHSGARYVSNDPVTARECRSESHLLKRLAPRCCEDTGGLFVAVAGDSESYIADFPQFCEQNGIAARGIDCRDARAIEPGLSHDLIAAFLVEDATIDPFRLSYDNMADAAAHGAGLLTHTRVSGMVRQGRRIRSVQMCHLPTGREIEAEAEQVVNATGAWVGKVVEMAGLHLPAVWSKGSLLITQQRIAERVVNRLRPPTDADIVVPGGTVSILGTTSVRVDNIEKLRVGFDEVDLIVEETAKMFPSIRNTRMVRAFAGVRPLLGKADPSADRTISRGFEIIDHERDGLTNLVSVVNGKLTTYRLTAEKAADLVCRRLAVSAPCLTGDLPLPEAPLNDWVVAGLSPALWRRQGAAKDSLLCECEMVPMSAVAQLVDQLQADGGTVTLDAIRLRSRMGKGSCQGTFCSLRTVGFLYDLGLFRKEQGILDLKAFLESRWKGLQPVLWDQQLAQAQLEEAIHCGLFNLEAFKP
ncbi:MAG: anaerobic glycerol-3-phosphate dehydrogenase subunit GlpA [Syntrophobacteraceae bacterium]